MLVKTLSEIFFLKCKFIKLCKNFEKENYKKQVSNEIPQEKSVCYRLVKL